MGIVENLREGWERIRPPAVKESDCDVGTALYAATEAVFMFRFAFALILLYHGTTNDFHGSFHWLSYVNITTSFAFLLLAICSLCVAYDHAPLPIFSYFVEAFYFVAASLAVNSLFNVAALSCLVAHFTMAPKVRVRAPYIILPLLCHVPNVVDRYLQTRPPEHFADVMGEFIGIGAASLFVFAITMGKNFKEVRFENNQTQPSYVEIS